MIYCECSDKVVMTVVLRINLLKQEAKQDQGHEIDIK